MRPELGPNGDMQALFADRVIAAAWSLARDAPLEAYALAEHAELITISYLNRPMPLGGTTQVFG